MMAARVAASGPAEETEAAAGHSPLRRCLVTRRTLPKARLIRFVVDPAGNLVPDLDGKLPGRGMWLQARRDVVETACAKGSFARAAERPVTVPAGLAERVAGLLARRCLDLLGLARRAGGIAAGFEQAREWLRAGRAAALVEATDAAEGGRGKMAGAAREVPLVELFTAAELGAALGRDNAVHVALARGRLARRFVADALRLAGFRAEGRVVLPPAEAAANE
jgi:predicted RNA-binding protein YlxR (DUF448 family)/ribosomal protein L7Ae-like RNA K-turn-binding protein